MKKTYYPELDETLYTGVLENGLSVAVVPRKGFTKKLAYSYIKRSQAPFVIAADEISNWHLPIYACNDTLPAKSGSLRVKNGSTDEVVYECDFSAEANTSTLIARLPVMYSDKEILIFEWEICGEKGFNHYVFGTPPLSLDGYREIMERYGF